MKKIVLTLLFASYLFSVDFLVGFGYGVLDVETEVKGTKYESSHTRDLHLKVGVDLGTSRVLITQDNPFMASDEELQITTLSWHAIDKPNKFLKGYFGLGYSQFDYSNKSYNIDEKKDAYGVELGLMLLEEGKIYENIEMELGFRYFITKGVSNSDGFELDNFSNYYIGFNYLF